MKTSIYKSLTHVGGNGCRINKQKVRRVSAQKKLWDKPTNLIFLHLYESPSNFHKNNNLGETVITFGAVLTEHLRLPVSASAGEQRRAVVVRSRPRYPRPRYPRQIYPCFGYPLVSEGYPLSRIPSSRTPLCASSLFCLSRFPRPQLSRD